MTTLEAVWKSASALELQVTVGRPKSGSKQEHGYPTQNTGGYLKPSVDHMADKYSAGSADNSSLCLDGNTIRNRYVPRPVSTLPYLSAPHYLSITRSPQPPEPVAKRPGEESFAV
ncbi:hypothetical protein WMY93_032060 [Mugilogobius chulae]|uniref:Uncharacterized protein n=1 Tax=Mugilogobius chulae TaxID=88201 RepID=A0AAW0MDL2_9GOBI